MLFELSNNNVVIWQNLSMCIQFDKNVSSVTVISPLFLYFSSLYPPVFLYMTSAESEPMTPGYERL